MRNPVDRPAEKQEARDTTTPASPTVLIATDGRTSSRAAIEKGLAIAHELGARVTFVSAYRPPWGALGEPFYQRSLTRKLGESRKAVDDAKVAAETFGTEADYEIVEGRPTRGIAALAAARDADLVVVGSRDLSLPVLRSSVSRSLVGHSDRAVLVAKNAGGGKRGSDAARRLACRSALN
jgi:nucleotide-binding universal stress UspA family protein